MSAQVRQKRIDEILFERGLITEVELKEALLVQKTSGGRLGSIMLRRGYVDEKNLVDVLAYQLSCPGVVLSSVKIDPDVIKRVPVQVALARKVVPFDYDQEQNVLKVACEDPTDESLAAELSFIVSGTKTELYVAAQVALDAAIAKYYLGQDSSSEQTSERPAVLFVTDEDYAVPLLTSLLEPSDYDVVATDSIEKAIDIVDQQKFDTIFVRTSLPGSKADLLEKMRRLSPATPVRHYCNASGLLVGEASAVDGSLFLENLDFMTSLLSSRAQLPENHGRRVAQFVERLCLKLKLPERDRLTITNAAYLHDLATSYYGPGKTGDARETVGITVKLLASLEYSPAVLDVLRHMYVDLSEGQATEVPPEVLGANIVTAVDLLCRAVPTTEHLSLDRFEAVQSELRSLVGKTLLADVVDGLMEILRQRVFETHRAQKSPQLMVFSEDPATQQLLDTRLRSQGFRIILVKSTASLIELYQRSEPDLIVLAVIGSPARALFAVDEAKSGGVDFKRTPTVVLADSHSISRMMALYERGIDDVILLDQNLDILVRRIRCITANLGVRSETMAQAGGSAAGTQGRLTDMNLFDLLQALGLGRKTVRITIRPNEAQAGKLTLYLNQGTITFAKTEQRAGPQAVHEALSWASGTWRVEPVAPEDLPAPNNRLSNESILMEWCRLQDESAEAVART